MQDEGGVTNIANLSVREPATPCLWQAALRGTRASLVARSPWRTARPEHAGPRRAGVPRASQV